MRITWRELAVDLSGRSSDVLLSSWRWLVPRPMVLRMVSSLGDGFLEDEAGRIHWLDVGAAQLTCIADSRTDFDTKRQNADNAETWFCPQLIGDLLSSGRALAVGECYSYKVPPTLGGKFELQNFEACDLEVHFSALGQMQAQIKDLPIGTVFTKVRLAE